MKTNNKMLLLLPLFILGSCSSNHDRSERRSEGNPVSPIDTYSEESKVANTVEE
jgi:hypothetical protein